MTALFPFNMPSRFLSCPIFAFLSLFLTVLASAQSTLTYDLETAGQWDANFRTIAAIGGGTAAQTAVSGNGFFRQDSTSGQAVGAYLFDQTPADTTSTTQSTFDVTGPITVAFDARSATSTGSFTVIFADPSNLNNNVSTIFSINTGADLIRFFRDGTPATAGAGAGTQVSTSSPNTGAEPGSSFYNLSFALTKSGTTPTFTITVGGTTYTSSFSSGDLNWTKTLIIIRLNDVTTSVTPVDIDNIVITSPAPPDNGPGQPGPNVAPMLPTQADRSIAALRSLVVTNTATDANTPTQTLTYQLTNPPAGASISSNGVITWTPTTAQVSATPYALTTVVTDNGSPVLSATNTFQVTVTAAPVYPYTQILDFATTGQFSAYFRTISGIGGGSSGQSNNNTLLLDANSAGGSTSAIYLFDTTPSDASHNTQTTFPSTEETSVSFLVKANTTDSSFAVSFADPRNANNRVTALFALKTGDDVVRFYRDGVITATTNTTGTQVGGDTTITTDAEPGGSFVPMTVTLNVSSTTPTMTVTVGNAAPVTSSFVAGDFDWTSSLLFIRLTDASSNASTPVEISNIVINGGLPTAPPAAVLPPNPGTDGNLLTINPSFETGSLNNFSGAYSFTGWTGTNALFSSHAITSGSVAAGTTTDGVKKLLQSWGGTLNTAVTARPVAIPGMTYELRYDQRSLVRNYPDEKLGTIPGIEFFDAAGVRIKQIWGLDNNYKVQYMGANATNVWETFIVRGVAPLGAAYVGVAMNAPIGRYTDASNNFTQDRHVEFDNFQILRIAETVDRLAYRRIPRLVELGKSANLKIHHAAVASRTLRAALVDSTGVERAVSSVAVSAGRFRADPLSVFIPQNLPNGIYSWFIELLPTSGGPAVATLNVPNVIVDQTVATPTTNGTDFDSDHSNVQFMGRVDNTNPKQQWLHWFSSETRVRFSGTSLSLRGTMTDNGFGSPESTNLQVIIDENFAAPLTVTVNSFNFVKTLVSGLTDTVHTARIFKANETDISVRVDGFRVDAGRGLLKPEPLPNRRLEVYGDSVTSGSAATPGFNGYAPLLGRELDTDVRVISKGGTGVAASFSGQDILVNYYNNLSFPNVFNAATGLEYNLSLWTPDVVVCAIGHNDQFNNGTATFNSRYAKFKGYIRTAYPSAQFITLNTLISAPEGFFQNAVDPLIAADSKHTFAFQPNTWVDSATGHPPTAGHAAMVYGDERRYSYAEVVEDRAGWGLSTPLTGYEQWTVTNFASSEIAAGLHAPEAITEGVSNLQRYASGVSAHGSVPVDKLPAPGLDAQGRLTLSFPRGGSDVNYMVEVSSDLALWEVAAVNPGTQMTTVLFTDNTAPVNAMRRFVRLVLLPNF